MRRCSRATSATSVFTPVVSSSDEIPFRDWVPVSTADDKETGEKLLVTQYEGSVIEEDRFDKKWDFLGFKDPFPSSGDALENVRLSKGLTIDIDKISLEDEKTYELYSAGNTVGNIPV